jgi:arylsulfatase
MKNVDREFLDAALQFIDRANAAGGPFFVWFNSTRTHVWTHLSDEADGATGYGL